MDPERNDLQQVFDQFSILVNRYNSLVERAEELTETNLEDDEHLKAFKSDYGSFVKECKSDAADIKIKLKELIKLKQKVGRQFKTVLRKDYIPIIERRIDRFDYENLVGRDEFLRLLSRQL